MKMRLLLLASILLFSVLFAACGNQEMRTLPAVSDYMSDTIIETVHLRVGVVTGPYQDMFEEAILPSLIKMGYTAKFVYYYDYSRPNLALANNEIDLNIFQHYTYLNIFKFEYDLALSAIMEIPTVSMSIFSNRFHSIDEIVPGVTVSIPDDASNLARALRVLEAAGIINLDPTVERSKATVTDIVSDPFHIHLIPLPAHDLVESLGTHDISVINGNYAVNGGLDITESLFQETLVENYMNVIAVRTEDLNKQFVRDIIGVVYSDGFRDVITDPGGNYAGFQRPRWFHDAVR